MKKYSMISLSICVSIMLASSGSGIWDLEKGTFRVDEILSLIFHLGFWIEILLIQSIFILSEKKTNFTKGLVALAFIASIYNLSKSDINNALKTTEKSIILQLETINDDIKSTQKSIDKYQSITRLKRSEPMIKRRNMLSDKKLKLIEQMSE